ncbi:MAG: apolipoprotein N-acyltransferase, partial [Planctomycetes bacterium]|nr:apolipoprotein N-acyltransferase [Planctomycetota bacterium]
GRLRRMTFAGEALWAEMPTGRLSRLLPRGRLGTALLTLLSVALLSASFAPFDYWYLAYVALVPWALALLVARNQRWALLCCYLGGLAFWGGMYWLWPITVIGYFALIAYLATYWLVGGMVFRSAYRRGVPAWIALPVVWVALEYARAHVMTGFTWFFLAHSQYERSWLIQIADVTGQYGVSFLVAMVNGLLIDLLAPRRSAWAGRFRRVAEAALVTASVLAGMLVYGRWRIAQWEQASKPGPVIGVVQRAFELDLHHESRHSRETIFRSHAELTTDRLAAAGCDLIIWPETVLPSWLNSQMQSVDPAQLGGAELRSLGKIVLGPEAARTWSEDDLRRILKVFLHTGGRLPMSDGGTKQIDSARSCGEELSTLVRQTGAALLAGGMTGHVNSRPSDDLDHWAICNSALLFDRTGRIVAEQAKVHLVPFGEVVPFKYTWPWLHKQLRRFVPQVMPQIQSGPEGGPFELEGLAGRGPWRLAGVICFEGTFARVCRRRVMADGRKRADILANLSNDGWFVWRRQDGQYRGTTEQAQHLVQYCFRAIELRVPVVRAVNTGISASIDSNGRIAAVLQLDRHTRTMINGTLLLDDFRHPDSAHLYVNGPIVRVDSRVSPYSVIGDVFALCVSVAAAAMLVFLVLRRRRLQVEERKK